MHTNRMLRILQPDDSLQIKLSRELRVSKILAQLLINRRITCVNDADRFLNAGLSDAHDPFLFEDMPKAVRLIKEAVAHNEQIMIFSDYDVDGITSLTLLKNTITRMGGRSCHYIPNRILEGYGLNKNVLNCVKDKGIKFLITADCGTNSLELIRELKNLGATVIVTDHHEPSEGNDVHLASALINPKSHKSRYKFRDLAGVGVAYKFCQALTGNFLNDDLDLVSIGTVADAVPLVDENRIFVKEGLDKISETKRLGLKALIEASRLKGKKITPEFISFILGPRINASGRMETAEIALNLFMSQEKEEAQKLAMTIEGFNRQRQKVESLVLDEASDLIDREVNFKEHKVIVIAKEGWHPGVLGIVAAKIADRFYRPTILISLTQQLCRGSGRSIKNFHLFESVLECRDLLNSFGGHRHAVGMVIHKEKIETFRDRLNTLAADRLLFEDLVPSCEVDMQLGLSDLSKELTREIGLLEPFGSGNREPLFFTPRLKLKTEPSILSKQTLKFWVTDGYFTYPAIGFRMAGLKESLLNADYFNLVYSLKSDNWKGQDSFILEVKDVFFNSP